MTRFHAALLFCLAPLVAVAVTVRELPSPAGPGALGSSLNATPDGSVLLSWLEPRAGERDSWQLKFSRLDAVALRWSEPRTIAGGTGWFVNWADFPSVTPLGNGHLLAIWFVENQPAAGATGDHGDGYRAVTSLSADDGQIWCDPQPLTGESGATEFAAALPLGRNERALVAWLDGRQRSAPDHGHGQGHDHSAGDAQALYAQTLLASGPDRKVDGSVCDCCQLSLVRVGGEALLAYRGRTAGEVRDIRLARWRDGEWSAPRMLHDDGWEIAACPVNGPRLAAHGRTVAAIWFTGAQGRPRVQAKLSTDGGETFGPAHRLDLGRPQGRVDAVVLPDGRAVLTWLENRPRDGTTNAGGLYLRQLDAAGQLGEPVLLADSSTARASGFPRLAVLGDGRLVLSHTLAGPTSRVATLLLDLK